MHNLFINPFINGKGQTELFKHKLSQIERSSIIKTIDNQSTPQESFNTFFEAQNKYFPSDDIKIKPKAIQNPGITKGITKSSKKKKSFMNVFRSLVRVR